MVRCEFFTILYFRDDAFTLEGEGGGLGERTNFIQAFFAISPLSMLEKPLLISLFQNIILVYNLSSAHF